jgi:threonine dehydratase
MLADASQIEAAIARIRPTLPPTPQIEWPRLCARAGCRVTVKHENHLPTGAFKIRGGVNYAARLRGVEGVAAATRGNHGQSVAFAAKRHGLGCTIVVPHGNSQAKNAAMRALGAELIEYGADFIEARTHARGLAEERGLHFVPSLHPWLVEGVATYTWELLRAVPDIDALYVPIGIGSGILGAISARQALGREFELIGVVSEVADGYARSFETGEPTASESAATIADGVAVRVPEPEAVALVNAHASRIVRVSEDRIRAAMRHYFDDTQQVVEGAGAVPLAALLLEAERMQGRHVALIASGGNVDRSLYQQILAEA